MKTKYLLRLVFLLFILEISAILTIHAQSPKFRIPLSIKADEYDASYTTFQKVQGRDTLIFGVNSNATICLDPDTIHGFTDHWFYSMPGSGSVDLQTAFEEELPPPFGFDPRISNNTKVRAWDQCMPSGKKNIHTYSSPTQKDSFLIVIYVDGSAPSIKMTLKWPSVLSEYATTARLRVNALDTSANVDMTTDTTISFRVDPKGVQVVYVFLNDPKVPPLPPDNVALVSPALGDSTQGESATLQWSSTPNANFYRLNVSKNPAFSPMMYDTILTSTTFNLTKLKSLTRYYWRVYAATKYGLSFFPNPPFNFKTKTFAPAPPVRVYPDTNAVNVGLNPQIYWRKISSPTPATYQVQVAGDTSFSVGVMIKDTVTSDSSLFIGSLQNCYRYFWRVRATNADGIGDWSTKWIFRTVLTTPNTPTQSSPPDSAQNVSINPAFSWTGDICSDSYRLTVAHDSLFTRMSFNSIVSQTFQSLSNLDQDSVYYWKIKARNGVDSSGYTSYRSFTTILLPAAIPAIVSPASGDTTQDPVATMRWRKVPYAESYHLQISKDQNFGTFEYNDSTLTDTSQVTPSLTNCTFYYWKVRAKNRNGSAGFTFSRNFRIKTAIPNAPDLLTPPNGKDSLLESVTLSWKASDICTQSYYYHLSTSSSFTDTVRNGSTAVTSVLITGLRGNLNYYWRVKAVDYLGGGPYSETRQFHTIRSRPDTVLLISPANGMGGLPSDITFRWDSSAFADSYRLQIAFDSAFTSVYFNDSSIIRQLGVQPVRLVNGMLNSRTFYWRVLAKNDIGYSNWSAVRRLVTLFPPGSPHLIEPVKDSTNITLTPLFIWSLLDRTDAYQLQVSKDTIFSQMVFNDSNITLSSWRLVYPLDGYTKYFWRVRGKNSAGWGALSAVYTFTTTRIGVGKWLVPLTIAETGSERMTIYYGVNPEATKGIDPAVGEYELPPPQLGYFDARFVSPYIGEGLLINYHEFSNYTQVDTFQLSFQPGMGSYPMVISWSRTKVRLVCDSMLIMDKLAGATIRARMDIDSFVIVNNSTINSLYIISHGAYPVVDVKPIIQPVPKGYALFQNYPNPFNPSTKVFFSTDHTARIRIAIYDLIGREVTTLADRSFPAGVYNFEWNGFSTLGAQMPSGVYYVRMIAVETNNPGEQFVSTKKMLMMK